MSERINTQTLEDTRFADAEKEMILNEAFNIRSLTFLKHTIGVSRSQRTWVWSFSPGAVKVRVTGT